MNLDKIDIILVKRAVQNPGTHQKEIYRPLLGQRSEFFLHKRIKCLEACGFLRLRKNTGTVQVWATKKGARHLSKNLKDSGESEGAEE